MTLTKRLRVAAFGVGRMGQVHLELMARLAVEGQIEIVAIGDRQPATLTAADTKLRAWLASSSRGGWSLHHSPEDLIARVPLDAAVVASRTMDHVRDSLAFVQRSIPVLVEKPLGGTLAEAAAFMRQLGTQGDQRVQVAFQRHYDPALRRALQWVTEGRIGQIQQSHHVLQDKNPTPPAYQSYGITADMAIHLIFEALSFHQFQMPRSVQALRFMAPHYPDPAGEGASVVHAFCDWADGSVAHLWGSRINHAGYDNGCKLMGTEGRIDVGDFVGDFGEVTLKWWRGAGRDDWPRGQLAEQCSFPMSPPTSGHPDFYPRFATAYAAQLHGFLDRVATGEPFEVGPDIGWKTLLVANVAEASARLLGRRFELTMPNGQAINSPDQAAEYAQLQQME